MKIQSQIGFSNLRQQGFSIKELLGVLTVVGLIVTAACYGGYYASRCLIGNQMQQRQMVETPPPSPEAATADSQPQPRPQPQPPQPSIVIKGLYIGLNYNSLPSVVSQKFDSGQWQIENDNYPYCYVRSLDLEKARNSYMQVGLDSVPEDLKELRSIKVDVALGIPFWIARPKCPLRPRVTI